MTLPREDADPIFGAAQTWVAAQLAREEAAQREKAVMTRSLTAARAIVAGLTPFNAVELGIAKDLVDALESGLAMFPADDQDSPPEIIPDDDLPF